MIRPKHIIVLAISAFALLLSSCEGLNNPNIISPVRNKKVKSISKWVVDNLTNDKNFIVYFEEYNTHGQLLTKILFNSFNDTTSKSSFIYRNGKLDKETVFDYQSKGDITKKTVQYKYENGLGKVSEKIISNGNGDVLTKINIKYNEKGNVISEKEFDPQGQLKHSDQFKYDYHEGKVRNIHKNSSGKYSQNSCDSIVYQQNGVIKLYKMDHAGDVKIIRTVTYDTDGRIISEMESNTRKEIIRTYKYFYTFF